MGLALDYRPATFKEVVGNGSTIKEIQAVLKRDKAKVPHTYLFTGPSGCGKTTLGRILAKELGCVGSDYYELDTADFRGIDTIRELRGKMAYAPSEGDCRVFLLDECHKLTNDAQNAILKALEEAPGHVYFVLCTTDPQKLLTTIRNRCVHFAVTALTDGELESLLASVVDEEGKDVKKDILGQIVDACMGSPRSALQMLEKVIDLEPRDQKRAARKIMTEQNESIDLCRALIRGDKWPKVAAIIKNLEETDLERLRHGVMGYCASILLKEDNARAFLIMDAFEEPWYVNGRNSLILACYRAIND